MEHDQYNSHRDSAEPFVLGPRGPLGDGDQAAATDTSYSNILAGLRQWSDQFVRLRQITERINRGLMLDEVLEYAYQEIRKVIPCNRVGFSLLDETNQAAVAYWEHSDRPTVLKTGYRAALAGSSLQIIFETARPRIINDLEAYLQENPHSHSTRLIVQEGMKSSMTCPLIAQGKPIGFIFFDSDAKFAYSNVHTGFFAQLAGQLSMIVEKGRLYSELAERKAIIQKQNEKLTYDLQMARKVQRAMLPAGPLKIAGLELALEYRPTDHIGGDVLSVVPLAQGRTIVFLGDVMGHGVPAALIMSAVNAAVRSQVFLDPSPVKILEAVNSMMRNFFDGHFVTAACSLIDVPAGDAALALGGHASPLWLQTANGNIVEPGLRGSLLGLDEVVELEQATFRPARGDLLLFYTDGIVEAFDRDNKLYGLDRLKGQLLARADDKLDRLLGSILHDLLDHCAGRPLTDDIALLAVRFMTK
ncbi:MAG: SpoIIE family protein phosphatase [Planctomycetes bacterium]|nr:SpoIIE family protein phosphatase [Planctomycetota bacterium]